MKDVLEWWEDGGFLNDKETYKNLKAGMEFTQTHQEALEMIQGINNGRQKGDG
jgi:hypothetical protein